jgi:hypothetical protein
MEGHEAWFFVGVFAFIFLIWVATGGSGIRSLLLAHHSPSHKLRRRHLSPAPARTIHHRQFPCFVAWHIFK